jgi:hypothetical protein
VTAGTCLDGQRLEIGTPLRPGSRYFVQLLALPPVARVEAVLEVHPDQHDPPHLVTGTFDVPGDAPLVVSLPEDGGLEWTASVVAPARLAAVVKGGSGTVAVGLGRVGLD